MKNNIKAGLAAVVCLAALMPFLGGCKHEHDQAGGDHPAAAAEPVTRALTLWTARTELFIEHKLLVAGKETSFAAHVTELAGFKPVAAGRLALIFTGSDGAVFTFAADKPSNPGIFRPAAALDAGIYRLRVELDSPGLRDRHDAGEVRVFANPAAAADTPPGDSNGAIGFLKEQQWRVDFMVSPAGLRRLASRFHASGIVRAPAGRHAAVPATVSGIILPGAAAASAPGVSVSAGGQLAVIRSADGTETAVLSPVSGVISLAQTTDGEAVEKGWKLFEIADLSSVWVEARIHETEAAALTAVSGALVSSLALDRPAQSSRVISIGASLDRESGTIPLVFEVPNPGGRLRIGSQVSLSVEAGSPRTALAVPAQALVDEDGTIAVYVQTGGESFERRLVETGVRDGDFVEIKSGLRAGERVVTRGAYKVRLAAASSSLPAHGHGH